MYANKSRKNDTSLSSINSNANQTFQFIDNRDTNIHQFKHKNSIDSFQNMANDSERVSKTFQLQSKVNNSSPTPIIQTKKNDTGLPDNLKNGIENISGYSMDDVKVHFNSNKPAQLKAHAYAQGSDIHIAPGQERHLAHEAWHVVQQKQNRVQPTTQLKNNVNVNDDAGLEREADIMGQKSLNAGNSQERSSNVQLKSNSLTSHNAPVQGYFEVGTNRISENMNIVWEDQKDAYATAAKFTESNQELDGKNGKILLHKGATRTYGGNVTFYKIEPRLNPRTTTDQEQNLQPTMGDSDDLIRLKHEHYIQELEWVAEDLTEFRHEFPDEISKDIDWQYPERRKAVIGKHLNKWCGAEPYRFDLLFMALAQAVFEYLKHESLGLMIRDIMGVEHKYAGFVNKERNYPNAISLPNDCAQCVSEIVGGMNARERNNKNPDVGGNYFEQLKSPQHNQTGWNFHWAGVIMKDATDNVTLESAGGMSLTNNDRQTWWFAMYGTQKKEQTFEHQIKQIHYERNIKALQDEMPETFEDYHINKEHFGLIVDIKLMQNALKEHNGK